MTGLQIYRRWLFVVLAIALFFTGFYIYYMELKQIPDSIMLQTGTAFPESSKLCTVSVEKEAVETAVGVTSNIPEAEVEISSSSDYSFQKTGSYTAEYKLFGLIDLKTVDVKVVEPQKLYAGGFPIGIYVETEGVMIIGTGTVNGIDGSQSEPAKNIVQSGDYIISINGEAVSDKEELMEKVNQYGAADIILGIRRNEETIKVKLRAVQTAAEEYKLGIWIRDNTQGVGMVSYLKEDGTYAALGHGITDVDTGLLMEIDAGKVFETEIVSIIKGKSGSPGELIGMIDYQQQKQLGNIEKNTQTGIFGKLEQIPQEVSESELLEIAMKEEIQIGTAQIQTTINGKLERYEIEIQEININDTGNKGMVIQVTDEDLLQQTGGIVQGMSGSPILQNGKIVGAVTHVFVNDATKGYGIFIENMLKESE